MDFQFASKLQTHMQTLGHKNGFAPPASQDPADALMHEYYVAETGRSLFDKRRKIALDTLKDHIPSSRISEMLTNAEKGITGANILLDSEHYSLTLATKSPTETLDKIALRNELVRLGVDETTVAAAFKVATKRNKPAETYTVVIKT